MIVNCYKGDALDKGNYGTLKMSEQVMKGVETVLEKLLRVTINEMQFGFMPGQSTTEAIFIVRRLQEKYLGKHKKLYFAIVDLEKALTGYQER